MKKLAILFLLLPTLIFAQKNKVEIVKNEAKIGYNIVTNSDIIGYEYKFPEKIYYFRIDTLGFLSVQLRGVSKNGKCLKDNGNVFLYNINNDSLLWTKRINYKKDFFWHVGNHIIFNTNKNQILDIQSGKVKYNVLNDIYFTDLNHKVGVGYKISSSKQLMATSLEDGKRLWTKNLDKPYNLKKLTYLTDSSVLIASNGLHFIDIYTGKEWNFNTKTTRNSSKDAWATAGIATLGVLTGIFFGVAVIPTGETIFRGIESNAMIDSDFAYIASSDMIAKIDLENGNDVWTAKFEKNTSSQSYLFDNENFVYMINYGVAYMNNQPVYCGKAFVAAYDKNSGEQSFINYFDKKEIIQNQFITDNYFIFNVNNKLLKFDFWENKIVDEQIMPTTSAEVNFIYENQIFIEKNGKFIDLTQTDFAKIFAWQKTGQIFKINEDFEFEHTEEFEDLFVNIYQFEDYQIVTNRQKTLMIDREGNQIAEFNTNSKVIIIDNVLYYIQDNSLYYIDLIDIFSVI